MRRGQDLVAEFPGLVVIHQKIPGREVGRHQHAEHEFFLPLQGEITLTFADVEVRGGPGRMVYAPPKCDHSFSSSASGEGERVIFLIDGKLWKKHSGATFGPLVTPASSLVRELIFFLLLNPKTPSASAFISALISALSEHMAAISGAYNSEGALVHLSGKIQDPRVRKAVDLLQNVEEQPAMAELARQSGMSVRSFNRLFIEELNMAPKQYATLLRVEKAKTLLLTSKMTITDIAQEAGYQSLSKFISAFQKYTGQLPSEYRARSNT